MTKNRGFEYEHMVGINLVLECEHMLLDKLSALERTVWINYVLVCEPMTRYRYFVCSLMSTWDGKLCACNEYMTRMNRET